MGDIVIALAVLLELRVFAAVTVPSAVFELHLAHEATAVAIMPGGETDKRYLLLR
jgi:hypothetical protein